MRLLNVHTLELKEFVGEETEPAYAILSHTWQDDEVNFAEFASHKIRCGRGYDKIVSLCELACKRGLNFVWIDTCCVDKRSSAELSETINSIFRWYSQAAECYALLSDVTSSVDDDVERRDFEFERSRWFTRGWTLPELLAPRTVTFVDRFWKIIGYKLTPTGELCGRSISLNLSDQHSLNLNVKIEAITGIPRRFLEGESLSNASIDDKINWVHHRRTTRLEDMAYCLLGILGLSMDLRYGEGSRAFIRLRDEIIRWENDDLPETISSGIEAIEILRLPRRRAKRNAVPDTQRKYAVPSPETQEGIELQPTTGPSQAVMDLARISQAQTLSMAPTGSASTSSTTTKHKRRLSLPTCWIIIMLASLVVGGSLVVGLFYSIAKDQMGDGFTVAGFIIAVGTLALAVPITQHYPRCRCWKKVTNSILASV
jgi:hypothetical protein